MRAALTDLEADLLRATNTAMHEAVDEAKADAKATPLFQDQTGLLRSSIEGDVGGFKGTLTAGGPNVNYASFVENGTPPHEIRGKGGGLLRFVMNGRTIFARSVHHPGTAERPFMAHAAALGEQVLEHRLGEHTDTAIDRFNARP